MDNLRVNAPRLFNHYDRNAQKAKYRGEIFPSDQPVGNYGDNSFEFFQKDRNKNKKGIIAIDVRTLSAIRRMLTLPTLCIKDYTKLSEDLKDVLYEQFDRTSELEKQVLSLFHRKNRKFLYSTACIEAVCPRLLI